MNTLSAIVFIKWKWLEASGRKCSLCGDTTFLKERQLFYRVNNGPEEPMKDVVLCQSCGELITDGL